MGDSGLAGFLEVFSAVSLAVAMGLFTAMVSLGVVSLDLEAVLSALKATGQALGFM